MSPEDHCKHFFEIVNRRDLDAIGDGLAEEAELYFPETQPLRGRNQIIYISDSFKDTGEFWLMNFPLTWITTSGLSE